MQSWSTKHNSRPHKSLGFWVYKNNCGSKLSVDESSPGCVQVCLKPSWFSKCWKHPKVLDSDGISFERAFRPIFDHFAGPFFLRAFEEMYFLVAVNYLTGWPVACIPSTTHRKIWWRLLKRRSISVLSCQKRSYPTTEGFSQQYKTQRFIIENTITWETSWNTHWCQMVKLKECLGPTRSRRRKQCSRSSRSKL